MTGIYKPTLEDIAYLANEHPEKFKNANETLRSIENVMNHDPVVRASTEDATIINQYEDYLKRGGEHLSDSPIPKEVEADSDIIQDKELSSPNCDCKPLSSCCIESVMVKDSKDATRCIKWPLEESGKKDNKLHLVLKEIVSAGVEENVQVEITGNPCKQGLSEKPCVKASANYFKDRNIVKKEKVPIRKEFALFGLASAYFPDELSYLIYFMMYYSMYESSSDSDQYRFKVDQCCSPEGTTEIIVNPVPYMELSCEKFLAKVFVKIPYAGKTQIGWSLETGNFELTYGSQKVSIKAAEEGLINSNQPDKSKVLKPSGTNRPFFEKAIDNMIDLLKIFDKESKKTDKYRIKENVGADKVQSKTSSVEIGFGVGVSVGKIYNENVTKNTGYRLVYDSPSISLIPTISVKFDLLELFIARVPKLADAFRDARKKASNKNNPAYIDIGCDLTFSVEGKLSGGFDGKKEIWVNNSGNKAGNEDFDFNFSGVVTFKITLEMKAEVGINKWYFTGGAEAKLSAETASHFGVRECLTKDGLVKEKYYYFEGLYAKGSFRVFSGSASKSEDVNPFETEDENVTLSRKSTSEISNKSDLINSKFEVPLLPKIGEKDVWETV
ncbi:hypothetical protein [Neptunomonas phycophila]|uniref:hypothetical protein n=1 Tax=Neptunomonas phycophila TaxID=1572645 RepID=UPI000948B8EB|nr:hypothetical protein [Neptunomonas phycophila]